MAWIPGHLLASGDVHGVVSAVTFLSIHNLNGVTCNFSCQKLTNKNWCLAFVLSLGWALILTGPL